jgi:hypothetical protein
MGLQDSTALRNAILDQRQTSVGASPVLKIYTGSPPGAGNAATGTILASLTLPSSWMNAASGGTKTLAGTWQTTSALASGTPGYARMYDATGTTVYMEWDCGVSGGTMSFNTAISLGGTVTINTFNLTAGNP